MSKLNRRRFIKSTAAAAGILSVPTFSIGKPDKPDKSGKSGESANNKINVAVVGAGVQGGYAVTLAAKEDFAAICDVDDKCAERGFESQP
nr:hypothetical protein [Planctomycetota bacterium]